MRRAAAAAALDRESGMQRGGHEDSDWEPDDAGLPAIGREATPSAAHSKSTDRVHKSQPMLSHGAEVDPGAASSKAAAKTQKKMPLEERQAEQKEEVAKVCCARL